MWYSWLAIFFLLLAHRLFPGQRFLLRNPLIIWWAFPYRWWVIFLLLLSKFSLCPWLLTIWLSCVSVQSSSCLGSFELHKSGSFLSQDLGIFTHPLPLSEACMALQWWEGAGTLSSEGCWAPTFPIRGTLCPRGSLLSQSCASLSGCK